MKAIITTPPYRLEFTCVKKEDGYYTHAGIKMKKPTYHRWIERREELLPGEQEEMFEWFIEHQRENVSTIYDSIVSEDDKFDAIVNYICEKKGVTLCQVKERTRKREVVFCRQLCFYILKLKITHLSFGRIGEKLGGRDHTTVIHGIQTINDLMDSDPFIRREVTKLSMLNYWSELEAEGEPELTKAIV